MDRANHSERVKRMVRQVSGGSNAESLLEDAISERPVTAIAAQAGQVQAKDASAAVRKAINDDELTSKEVLALEAIILPRMRPVVFIENGTYGPLPHPWSHWDGAVRTRLETAIPAIGRIELPDNPLVPYGGTGFVVGSNVIMTNRHVAELFARGLGAQTIAFRSGQAAAVDFKRERNTEERDRSAFCTVREVLMIHPYWDMALLRVDHLPPKNQAASPLHKGAGRIRWQGRSGNWLSRPRSP